MENNAKYYPEYVLVEILCRLPSKPLIRFKCVSKTWYILFSEVCVPRICLTAPVSGIYFRTYSYSRGPYDPICLEYASLEHEESGGEEFDIKLYSDLLPFKPSGKTFLDSCNGLVLFVNTASGMYYVCNPTTRQCVQILEASDSGSSHYASLAFNPSESPHYNVVRFARVLSKSPWLDIYASRTGRWVRHIVQLDRRIFCTKLFKHSVYLNGMLYRLSETWQLVCFNLNVVNARVIELPDLPTTTKYAKFGCIGSSMGHLCYAKCKQRESRLLIWLLEDRCEAGEWILKYSVCISDLEKQLQSFMLPIDDNFLWFQPYAFHPISDVILIGTPGMILSYHLKNNMLKLVSRARKPVSCYYHVYTHSHCLVSLNTLGKMNCKSTRLRMIYRGKGVLYIERPYDPEQTPGSNN